MTDNVENLIVEHLRALRAGQERIEHELREMKSRMTSMESGIASLRRDNADFARQHDRRSTRALRPPRRPHRSN